MTDPMNLTSYYSYKLNLFSFAIWINKTRLRGASLWLHRLMVPCFRSPGLIFKILPLLKKKCLLFNLFVLFRFTCLINLFKSLIRNGESIRSNRLDLSHLGLGKEKSSIQINK
ncbi:hypothetical protein BpHYR1_023665 [Brachionus plicatilis]|uniref:Uncharacterized protein n=1 Tax=Brachionus plicatilis TaxID=10195 RepID=A0A3M7RAH1_BRAPC|nr:hypothetical protein BpHYR1_023665 [Brachionus plicatilis]